jgi:S-adenosylmethionine-dependent methyltransferase
VSGVTTHGEVHDSRTHRGDPQHLGSRFRSAHTGGHGYVTPLLTTNWYRGLVGDDTWASLADQFVDEAYASVKGRVRTYVLHQQLLEHLPAPPATVLDAGGGAGHQSFPLAQVGYNVTLLDPSSAMLDKARQRLQRLPGEAQRRVTLLQADGENADEAVERRWDDALASFELLRKRGVDPVRWYGVWLFVDWLEFSGAELDLSEASRRCPRTSGRSLP